MRVTEFQRNVGLQPDGICGPQTVRALGRLRGRPTPGPGVSAVREYERLSHGERTLAGRRVVLGGLGGVTVQWPSRERPLPAESPSARVKPSEPTRPATSALSADLARTVGRALRMLGSTVLTLDEPDGAHHAAAANGFDADVYVGLAASAGGASDRLLRHGRVRVPWRPPSGRPAARGAGRHPARAPRSPTRHAPPRPPRDPHARGAGGARPTGGRRRTAPPWPPVPSLGPWRAGSRPRSPSTPIEGGREFIHRLLHRCA